MHELGIAAEALQQTLEHTRRSGGQRVTRIVIRIGELSGVDGDALQFALGTLLPGTLAEAAAVEIEPVASVAFCATCRQSYSPDPVVGFACPRCGAPPAEFTHGRELELARLEFELS
jgi:hydrogenase nickel incorporation protein HypA/HybF